MEADGVSSTVMRTSSMQRAALCGSLVASVLVAALAFGKPKDDKTVEAKPASSASARGVQPYDQAIIDGHKAMAAGLAGNQLEDAITAYRKAIAMDPTRPEGHLYLGGALFQKADYAGAETALADAANRARADKSFTNLLGQALFMTATVKDAQGKTDDAKTAWTAYADFAKSNPDQKYPDGSGDAPPMMVKVYPGSALDRGTKIDTYKKMVVDYAKVKDLIEKRQKELGMGTPEKKPSP